MFTAKKVIKWVAFIAACRSQTVTINDRKKEVNNDI